MISGAGEPKLTGFDQLVKLAVEFFLLSGRGKRQSLLIDHRKSRLGKFLRDCLMHGRLNQYYLLWTDFLYLSD